MSNGVEAMAFLRQEGEYANVPRPELILLDLNLPRKDGREVLGEIKNDDDLKRIPVVILTSSQAEQDIVKSYNLHANCFITKPVELDQFIGVIKSIEQFLAHRRKTSSRGLKCSKNRAKTSPDRGQFRTCPSD